MDVVDHKPNGLLRHLVEEGGLSEAQLAAEIRRVAAEHGQQLACHQSSVSRWLSGVRPRPPVDVFLLEALARRLGRPLTPAEAGLSKTVPDDIPRGGRSWEAAPVHTLFALLRADLDPARRRLLAADVYSLTSLALPAPAGPHASSPAAAHRAPTPAPLPARAQQMDTMARHFADAAEAFGGGAVRTALAGYLAHPVNGWLNAPAPEPVHRHLLAAAARLTLLLGTMTADDGHDALAQHYHHTAARMATDADDATALAITLRTMAAHASDLGHHTPAVLHLSQHAVDTARGAPPPVRAYTHAQLATAAAHHNRRAALLALNRAEQLYEKADTVLGPFTAYPLAALHYQRAQTLNILGDTRGSIGAYTASLRLRTPTERHARALTQARLGETLLAQGHLDAALTHWTHFLDAYPHLSSLRATRHLHTMRQLLTPHQRHRPTGHLLDSALTLR
ncbi:hypothetical protein C9F11_46250 (plasmid) [Streptomyces sp. YIM 121038]|uniref:helix-turn-helix domain-containing protein n=1 Tax=Streptomyces sp. YIM 121038 TaxID=2136401 RepID=UPI00116204BE|nr:helix-turn-helix transcriptional regulator [Streptomyces sp. YIM 121038]QCX82800.1 hypothetical protein C9F11_46250 [Streptomyces sp. YIM 121038]